MTEGDLIEEKDTNHDVRTDNEGGKIKITTEHSKVSSKKIFWEDQQSLVTLKLCLTRARERNVRCVTTGRWQFFLKDSVLFRYFPSLNRTYKHMLVPKSRRNKWCIPVMTPFLEVARVLLKP